MVKIYGEKQILNLKLEGKGIMGTRDERTSKKVAKIAGKVLASGKATPKQAKTLAASALTQAPNKKKK